MEKFAILTTDAHGTRSIGKRQISYILNNEVQVDIKIKGPFDQIENV